MDRAGLLERMPPMEKKEEKQMNGDVNNDEREERKRMKPSVQHEVGQIQETSSQGPMSTSHHLKGQYRHDQQGMESEC